jgi:hypothetical protein
MAVQEVPRETRPTLEDDHEHCPCVERLRVELAALNRISAGHLQACVIAEADAERLRTLIDKHNDECRECPVIELDSDKST